MKGRRGRVNDGKDSIEGKGREVVTVFFLTVKNNISWIMYRIERFLRIAHPSHQDNPLRHHQHEQHFLP